MFTPFAIAAICFLAFLVGLSRTAVPGFGTLVPIIFALVMPVKESTGFLLPILVTADIVAVVYWRKAAVWGRLLSLLPWAIAGIVIGYFLLDIISEAVFRPLLGCMIIVFVAFDLLRRAFGFSIHSKSVVFAAASGVLTGVFSMMANAAGPILTVYLLSLNLNKEDFVSTTAWVFMILNLIKIPFSIALGLITLPYMKIDLLVAPIVIAGVFIGTVLVKKIPQKAFNTLAQVLAAVAGIKLFF